MTRPVQMKALWSRIQKSSTAEQNESVDIDLSQSFSYNHIGHKLKPLFSSARQTHSRQSTGDDVIVVEVMQVMSFIERVQRGWVIILTWNKSSQPNHILSMPNTFFIEPSQRLMGFQVFILKGKLEIVDSNAPVLFWFGFFACLF